MLYAEIHGKLVPEAGDSERAEDVLTSTVWGTLFLVSAWEVVEAWLARSRASGQSRLTVARDGRKPWFRFWPRLQEAEPDLMLRLGETLVVVEAKYLSGMSGSGRDDDGKLRDQLARQWRSVNPQGGVLGTFQPDVREAVETAKRRCIVYLVRARSGSKALREMVGSLEHVPDADLHLLYWEDLHSVLTERRRLAKVTPHAWEDDLSALLVRRGLRAFGGFDALWTRDPTEDLRGLTRLLGRLRKRPSRLRQSLANAQSARVEMLWYGRNQWRK